MTNLQWSTMYIFWYVCVAGGIAHAMEASARRVAQRNAPIVEHQWPMALPARARHLTLIKYVQLIN